MNYQPIQVGERKWHIQTFGQGTHCLIALHGFGEDGSVFAPWEPALEKDFRLIAVDLPFHGRAIDWPLDRFQADDLISLIDYLPQYFSCGSYSLIGHSLGGRLILSCWQMLRKRPISIWLLAPDGLATRRLGMISWVPAGLRTWLGRHMEKQAAFWLQLAGIIHKIGMIDAFSMRYLRLHLSTPARRRRLMGIWNTLPYFPINIKSLLLAAQQNKPPIYLAMGDKDELIAWQRLEGLLGQWPEGKLFLLKDTGHNLINNFDVELLQKKIDLGQSGPID
ncbi:MAG: alpha/beta fold hydrolase [Saprospiraceae bacterium]|nr:alpha/beta fold hydrolase [Lewinella sp.]